MQFVFEPQIVRYHGNKLTIRGLSSVILNGVPKICVQGVHVAPIPRHFNRMADGTLHTGGGGAVLLGYRRVENFGD